MSCSEFSGRPRQWWLMAIAGVMALQLFTTVAIAQTNTNVALPRRPSIVLIVADGLAYDELGCYGQSKIKTTNIDQLAAEGMRFTNFYAGNVLSVASRTALMTGLHTGHAKTRGNAVVPLGSGDLTLTEVLKRNTYYTVAIGKWGLGDRGSSGEPRLKGFDEWFGYLTDDEARNYYPALLNRSRQDDAHDAEISENLNNKRGKYSNDQFTDAALKVVEYSKPEEFNNFRPFFVYLAYSLPGDGREVPNDAPYSGERWPQAEKNKAAMITRLDGYVGQLMDKLKALKMDRNTMVILTSDRGPRNEAGADPRFFHGANAFRGTNTDLYEANIRVPMIVRWPVRVRANVVSDEPFAAWDILPTVGEIARAPEPKGIDGISMLPTLLGQKQTNRHEFLYWEAHDNGFKQAARMGDWKAVRLSADGPLELYDLKRDPSEKKDVAEQNPEVIAKISDYLKKARKDDPNWPIQKTPPATDQKK